MARVGEERHTLPGLQPCCPPWPGQPWLHRCGDEAGVFPHFPGGGMGGWSVASRLTHQVVAQNIEFKPREIASDLQKWQLPFHST